MVVESEDYKLEILKYAVNQCIDLFLPKSSKDALSVILYKSNEVVWRVVTEIYTRSGHQIDFVFVRDVLNLRIEPLQNKIAEEERIRKEKEAKEAIIRAKLEAKKLAKIAEQERRYKKRKEEEERKLQELKKVNPDINIDNYKKFDAFIRIKDIIAYQLEVESERINLDTILDKDLNIDRYDNYIGGSADLMETVMAIEEELDIEISDEEQKNISSYTVAQLVDFVMQKANLY